MQKDTTPAIGITVLLKDDTASILNLETDNSEFLSLAGVVNIEMKQIVTQVRESFSSSYYVGEGKLSEISNILLEQEIDVIIFNQPLKAGIKKNVEQYFEKKIKRSIQVLDRNELIMAIFALHARSSEAKLQVELAQLEYLLPRLTGKGASLSRLGASGILRGPGETKLEIDRRRIKKRISFLKSQLKEIETRRELYRKHREDRVLISLIGYTNSGKSTLINALTKGGAIVEDQVFATLSPVTRKVFLTDEHTALISDTVGFIRDIPAELFEAFKSTLEEIKYSDILIYIIDISERNWLEKFHVSRRIVDKITGSDKPSIIVFNKVDLVNENEETIYAKNEVPDSIFISALEKTGLDELKNKIKDVIQEKISKKN
ncbi:MAG: GTPase HflX [bacterium]|nr:GTPase HflX [bacterium]